MSEALVVEGAAEEEASVLRGDRVLVVKCRKKLAICVCVSRVARGALAGLRTGVDCDREHRRESNPPKLVSARMSGLRGPLG
jgi:hypothetical protein